MCRFVAYKGREVFMSDLLTRSSQSLIRQSHHSRERKEPLNGDGFGVGWYTPEIDPTPGLFTGVQPAWADRNLARLAPKIRSTCFFAHVRAASLGSPVTDLNCHPFQYRQFLWMHNGRIPDFRRLKRHLRGRLNEEFYHHILGTTDSEHAFAVFLNELKNKLEDYQLQDLVSALRSTIRKLERWRDREGIEATAHYNFAVTDGHSILATRYASGDEDEAQTLYVASGARLVIRDDQYRMLHSDKAPGAVIIASEPLTEQREDWTAIPRNHFVSVSPELHLRIEAI